MRIGDTAIHWGPATAAIRTPQAGPPDALGRDVDCHANGATVLSRPLGPALDTGCLLVDRPELPCLRRNPLANPGKQGLQVAFAGNHGADQEVGEEALGEDAILVGELVALAGGLRGDAVGIRHLSICQPIVGGRRTEPHLPTTGRTI